MKSAVQKQELRTLIQRADAVSRQCKGEVLKCVREIRKELLLQLEEHDISRNADMRDRLIAETQRRIDRLRRRLDRLMDAQMEYASKRAYNGAGRMLDGNITRYSTERMEVLLDAIKARGGEGMAATFTNGMSKSIVTALRNATVSAFREQAVEGMTNRELMKVIRDKWIGAAKDAENFKFVDRGGRVWNTDNYLMMSVRTNSMAMYNDTLVDTIARTTGSDLVRISDDGGTADSCDACKEWAGRIVSVTGNSKDFPSLDEAKADGLFHPNCIHTIEPVDEELDADEIEAQRGGSRGR